MAWIELHQAVWTHRKTFELASRLDLDETYAAAHLIRLWTWALDNAPTGALGGLSDRAIAFGSGWRGDAAAYVQALVGSGWLDEDRQIHDWGDYAGRLIERRNQDAERKRLARAVDSDVRPDVRRTAERIRRTGPNRTGPDRTGKVSTKPSPPLASQDPPEGDDGAAAPTKPTPERKTSKRSPVATEPPEFLEPTETEYRLGETMGLSRGQVNLAATAMLDHWRAKGERRADWLASLRTWIRNGPKYDQRNRSSPSSQGTNGAGQPWNDESIYGKPITVEGIRT